MPKYPSRKTSSLYDPDLQEKRSKARSKVKPIGRPKHKRGILGEKAGFKKLGK
jgi:hypothetical protein